MKDFNIFKLNMLAMPLFDAHFGGLFFAMKYRKEPLSINNQVVKLKSKGLNFPNTAFARRFLQNINYYLSLIHI